MSEIVVREMCKVFTSSLLKTAIALDPASEHWSDSLHGHHWITPSGCTIEDLETCELFCACGKIRYDKSSITLQAINRESNFHKNLRVDKNVSELNLYNSVKLLDCYLGVVHSLQVAITSASTVLGIQNIIQQK